MKRPLWLILVLLWTCPFGSPAAGRGDAETEQGLKEDLRVRIAHVLADLDADEFATRTGALKRLREMAATEDVRKPLALAVQQALVDPGTSFEVRKQLEQLQRALPPADLPPAEKISIDQIRELIDQLQHDSYGRRLGAESRLRWLLGSREAVVPIYLEVKRRLTAPQLAIGAAEGMREVYDEARGAWLASDAGGGDFPPVADSEIDRWVDELASPRSQAVFPLSGEPLAAVELRDLLARPECAARVRAALEARRRSVALAPEADARLGELIDLARPAMVAEFWQGGANLNIQRLLVGVPSVSEGGTSHFDRIDDRTAHCVTGVNLVEGDYPVGVALPHPTLPSAFFHLVNLPTPRRRMAYEYAARGGEARRLEAIVARTAEYLLGRGRPLEERELTMLAQFPVDDASRFAGRYLASVADCTVATGRLEPSAPAEVERTRPSIHGLLCAWLGTKGTRAAIPGLLEAIDRDLALPPSAAMPYRFDRLAALAIARRDPWPEVDAWLARMVPRLEHLVVGQADSPELGATAAAILLARHGRRGGALDDFQIIACAEMLARQYGLTGYRYASEESHRIVERWWLERAGNAADKKTADKEDHD